MFLSCPDIIKATKGTLHQGTPLVKIKGISINSKTVKKGDLFIAVKGKRLDGHRYIKEAIRRGASVLMISSSHSLSTRYSVPSTIPIISVQDTMKALGLIAQEHRNKFSIPIIAITGSAGKTTTKDMIAHVLQSRYKVLKNERSENNHIGVPLTLLKLKASHDIAVMEFGTNCRGDIAWLTFITRPTMAVLTNIGEAHLELLRNPAQVFEEKFSLVKGMAKGVGVLYNADDPYLRKIPSRTKKHKCITFGMIHKSDYQASDLQMKNNRSLQFKIHRGTPMVLKTPVRANVYNALAAISCGRLMNIRYNNIQKKLQGFRFRHGRQVVTKVNGYWLIDDTYNANPVSFRSALNTLAHLKTRGRRVLICADMLELGARSKELHLDIGELAIAKGLDLIITYGKLSGSMTKHLKNKHPQFPVFPCRTIAQVHKKILNTCQPGDAILVKGSRRMCMERTVQFLMQSGAPPYPTPRGVGRGGMAVCFGGM